MKKKIKTILFDMDCILVEMLGPWLEKYNERMGTNVTVDDVKDYDVTKVCADRKVLDSILHSPGFFFDMEPMPGAIEYLKKFIEDGYDIEIVTQPPRRAEFAVRDKRRWMLKHIPDFDLMCMTFCHHKFRIDGDLLVDDKPAHLIDWKERHPNGITATIQWEYNKEAPCDWRFENQETAWKELYEKVTEYNRSIG